MNTALRTTQLGYTRNNQVLFQHLELELCPCQGLIIYGANGSGKTSLLRVLTGLVAASSGTIEWKGRPIAEEASRYHEVLHYLGHHPGVKHNLSVQENLFYSQSLMSTAPASSKQLETALGKAQLAPLRTTLAQHLSAGQKRRLALARLLLSPKPLWILDEPFTNLDQDGQEWLRTFLEDHLENQGMVVIASHQPLKLEKGSAFKTLLLKTAAYV